MIFNEKRLQYLAYGVFLLLTSVLLIGSYEYYRAQEERSLQNVNFALDAIADHQSKEIQSWRSERLGDVLTHFDNEWFTEGFVRLCEQTEKSKEKKKMSAWLTKVQTYYGYDEISLFDGTGNKIASSTDHHTTLQRDVQQSVRTVLQTGEILIVDLHRHASDSVIYFTIVFPIKSSKGTPPIGAVVLRINPFETIFKKINSFFNPYRTAEALLFRRDSNEITFISGMPLIGQPPLTYRVPLTRTELPAVQAILGKEGILTGKDYRGEPVLSSVRKINNSPWYIVVKVDLNEIESPLSRQFVMIVLFVIVCIAGLGSVLVLTIKTERTARLREKMELLVKENFLQEIIRNSLNEIYVFTNDSFRTTFVNEGALRGLGYSADEIVQHSIFLFQPDFDSASFQNVVQPLLSGEKETKVYETRHRRKDGTTYPVETRLQSMTANNEKIFVAFSTNLSARKEAEAKVRESEEKFRNIFEHSTIGKSLTGIDGSIKANKAFCDIVGYTKEECEKIDWSTITHPDDVQASVDIVRSLIAGKRFSAHFEKRYIHKSGRIVWTDVNTYLHRDSNNQPQYFITSISDITGKKEIEQKILREKQYVDNLIESLPGVFYQISPEKRFIRWNKNFETVSGYSAEEMARISPIDLFEGNDKANIAASIAKVFAEGSVTIGANIVTKNRMTIPYFFSGTLITAEGIPNLIGLGLDISAQKEAEEKVRKSEEQFRRAIADAPIPMMMHDENDTVLQISKGWTQYSGYTFTDIPTLGDWTERAYGQRGGFAKEYIDRLFEIQETVGNGEWNVTAKDGAKRIWDFYTTPIGRTDKGQRLLLSIAIDITDQKKATEDLRESEIKFRSLIQSTPLPLCLVDNAGSITFINDRFKKIFGYTLDDIPTLDEWWKKAYPDPAYRTWVLTTWNAAIETAREKNADIESVEYTVTGKNGNERIIVIAGITLREGFLATFIDITERKQAEEERNRFFNLALDFQCVAGTDGFFKRINPSFTRVFGYTEQELLSKPFTEFIHPEDVQSTTEAVGKLSAQQPVTNFVNRYRCADGSYRWLSWAATPFGSSMYAAAHDITEQKNYELMLQQHKVEMERAQAIAHLGNWSWNINDNTIEWSDEMYKIYGVQRDTFHLNLENLNSLIHPKDRRQQQASIESILAGKLFEPFEYRVIRPSGELREVLIYGAELLMDAAGKPAKILGAVFDVTERKKFEKELKIRNRINQIFLTTDNDDIYGEVLDVILDWTDSAFGVFGYIDETGALVVPSMTRSIWEQCNVPEKSIVFSKETWGDSIWPRSIREKKILFSNTPSSLTPKGHVTVDRNVAVPIIHRDAVIGLVQVANKPIAYTEDDIKQLRTISEFLAPVLGARLQRDREERERIVAQNNLEEAKERLELALSGGLIGVWEWDLKTDVTIWDERMEKMFGLPVGSFGGDYPSFKALLHPDDVGPTEEAIRKALEEDIQYNVLYRAFWPSGDMRYIKATAIVIKDAAHTPVRMIGVCSDLTEVKNAEENLHMAMINLEKSNKELEQFAYVASHDLQEPLRMVSSYTQLLERRYKDKLDSDANEFINYAVDGANRMQRLINDLLEYSRVTTRGKPFVKSDLSSVLGLAVANLKQKIEETNAIIINDPLPSCPADEIQMSRVFQNLLENAIKFRGASAPRIRISSEEEPHRFVIAVKDNGIGIEEKYGDRIFTIFQRLHTKEEYPGTGIGLAICKRTVERHGGTIWFTSVPGEGTTFYFTIPRS